MGGCGYPLGPLLQRTPRFQAPHPTPDLATGKWVVQMEVWS